MPYPKRLIEVDLPIKRISAHSRKEKAIRSGQISSLHIWWARRPLAACRAVMCASLWLDPVDPLCPSDFIGAAKVEMLKWAGNDYLNLLSKISAERFIKLNRDQSLIEDMQFLRDVLFDFIADFANSENSTIREFIETSKLLTQAAHEALGGSPDTRPMVVDPFAGGSSIPLEALRIGADAFASDLNPVPVLLNKVFLEYLPKYGQQLTNDFRKWGDWIKSEVEKELLRFYPKDEDGSIPITYLWARTIKCEGPSCGFELPLIRSPWLANKVSRSIMIQFVPNLKDRRVDFQIIIKTKEGWIDQAKPQIKIEKPNFFGTVKRGSATCPWCGYTTPVVNVRRQLKSRRGGAYDARLYCVVALRNNGQGRIYRLATDTDIHIVDEALMELTRKKQVHTGELSLVPNEPTPSQNSHRSVGSARVYGMDTWEDLFSTRQALALVVFSQAINKVQQILCPNDETHFGDAMQILLAFAFDKLADLSNSLCRWEPNAQCPRNLFGRQAIPMLWDFAEGVPIGETSGSWSTHINGIENALENIGSNWKQGSVERADATSHPLADDSADAFFTDPPYYDAVPYAEVSDFFYVWLKRNVPKNVKSLFEDELTPKIEQAIVWHPDSFQEKVEYEDKMGKAMSEGRRILNPKGIGIIVFAHKTTAGWEAQLSSMIEAGWTVTASWPLDTECGSRMNALGTAALASSVHLICRPRENVDGSLIQNQIGDWRDVQEELPKRIHEWMPRLAEEGVAGADAIFACLGPALEIFSRYTKVVQAGSERVISLSEYLEKVWAAVSQEALNMVFSGGDAQGLEEDARLTAMWLWTLTAGVNENNNEVEEEESDEEEISGSNKLTGGFVLEYDTARKIAQGLGANLDDLKTLIVVKGDKARLLPVMERANKLFGALGIQQHPIKRKKKPQLSLVFESTEQEEDSKFEMPELKMEQTGKTVLDRLHQAMLLFSSGRTEALKRFLVEDGVGKDDRFWKLAQSLTSLYPKDTDERRWVEALQTYKKGLGF